METNPDEIVSRRDFAAALRALKESTDRTVREIAVEAGIPASTVGGYLKGTHLPALKPPDAFPRLLQACGVHDVEERKRWMRALRRLRPTGREPKPEPVRGGDPALAPIVSTVPPVGRLGREPVVRGRADLVRELDTVRARGVHVLHGPGGSGKSTVALTVALGALERGQPVWWIEGAGRRTLILGFQALAVELGVDPGTLMLGSLPDLLWEELARCPSPWLLIIDGLDDPAGTLTEPGRIEDGNGLLRTATSGTVLITSRDAALSTWGPGVRRHWVAPLGPDDATDVLWELAGDAAGSREQALALARRLGGLPLGLRIAGGLLAEARQIPAGLGDGIRTYEGYRHALDAGSADGLFEGGPDERAARGMLGRTWELSLDLLAARGLAGARVLLRMLCCLRSAPIPYEVLLRSELLRDSPLFPDLTGRSLWTMLRALADLGLVKLSDEPGSGVAVLDVHPLIRDACRRQPDFLRERLAYLRLVTRLLSQAARGLDPRDPECWPLWRLLAVHCGSPVDMVRAEQDARAGADATVFVPGMLAARYLRAAGHLQQAEREYAELVEDGVRLLGPDYPLVLELRHDLSRLQLVLGRLDEAREGFRAVLADRCRVIGEDHPDTMNTSHYLARTLREAGRTTEGFALMKATLEQRTRRLGPAHPDTLTSMNNVGDMLREAGRLEEAEGVLERVLRARRSLLGREHPATLVTRHHWAELLRDLGRRADARAELRDLELVSVRVLGPVHPRTLRVRHTLGVLMGEVGEAAEARALLVEVLRTRSRVLGSGHPATAATRRQLARLRGGDEGADVPGRRHPAPE
ncbi:tetratricopeptide repeat protein [Actinomadura luteofluorescens]|uniref:tetratricopeptide repeat protein n=1 Tax=Actinomadura luteofluorescens TaxID=46163 RepID=UPI00346CC3BE